MKKSVSGRSHTGTGGNEMSKDGERQFEKSVTCKYPQRKDRCLLYQWYRVERFKTRRNQRTTKTSVSSTSNCTEQKNKATKTTVKATTKQEQEEDLDAQEPQERERKRLRCDALFIQFESDILIESQLVSSCQSTAHAI